MEKLFTILKPYYLSEMSETIMEQNKNMIENDIKNIKDIIERCEAAGEEKLLMYCKCMSQMYSICKKIEEFGMLSYEKEMMYLAYDEAIEHFIEQINMALELKGEFTKKTKIVEDIERSVGILDHVFQTVIHSTNKADGILFQTAVLSAGVGHYQDAKLCAYYACFLNKLSEVYDNSSNEKYTFCVYPSLCSIPETSILFSERKERGRVSVVKMPEYGTEDVTKIRCRLAHELYHVLPDELRDRENRARAFVQIMLYEMKSKLIEKYFLENKGEREKLDEKILDIIEKHIFDKCMEEISTNFRDDNNYYAHHVKEIVEEKINNMLINFDERTLKIKIMEEISDIELIHEYEKFKEIENVISSLLNHCSIESKNILCRGEVIRLSKFYMKLFSEVFSDIMMVLTLGISETQYDRTFIEVANKSEDNIRVNRPLLYYRKQLTANAISKCYDKSLVEKWTGQRNQDEAANGSGFGGKENEGKPDLTVIEIPDNIIKIYNDFFGNLCTNFSTNQYNIDNDTINELNKFRTRFGINFNNDLGENENLENLDFISEKEWLN